MADHCETQIFEDYEEEADDEPLDDTLVLENTLNAAQFSKAVVVTDDKCHLYSAQNTETRAVDVYEAEIVLDSDDEGTNRGPVHRNSKLHDSRDGILSPAEGQCLADSSMFSASHVSDNSELNEEVKKETNSRVFQSKRRMTSERYEQDVKMQVACSLKELGVEKEHRLCHRNHEDAGLNVKSQVPDNLSQADSLDFVDWYLSAYCDDVTAWAVPMVCEKSPSSVSNAKGPRNSISLASLAISESRDKDAGVFEWVDNHEVKGKSDYFYHSSHLFSGGKDLEQISLRRSMSVKDVDSRQQRNNHVQVAMDQRYKLNEKLRDFSISSRSLPLTHVRRTIHDAVRPEIECGKMSSKELDMLVYEKSLSLKLEASVEDKDADFSEVGIGTQIAAEAIEALYYTAPPGDAHRFPSETSDCLRNGTTKTVCSNSSAVWSFRRRPCVKPVVSVNQKTSLACSEKQRRNSSCSIQGSNSGDDSCQDRTEKPRMQNFKNSANVDQYSGRAKFRTKGYRNGAVQSKNKRNSKKKVINPPGKVTWGRQLEKFLPVTGGASHFIPSESLSLSRNSGGKHQNGETNLKAEDSCPCKKRKRAGLIADKQDVSKQSKSSLKLPSKTSANGGRDQYKQQLEINAISNLKKSNVLDYPRGKRISRTRMACVGGSDFINPAKLVNLNVCNTAGIRTRGGLQRKLETSSFSCAIKRKKRTSVYRSISLYSSVKRSCGNLQGQNEDELGLADIIHEHDCIVRGGRLVDVTTPEMEMNDRSKMQSNVKSSLLFCQGKDGLSSIESYNSVSAASSNCRMSTHEVYPHNTINGHHKQRDKTKESSSLTRELVRLGCGESMPDFTSKDLRRRRTMANMQVLLSQNLEEDIFKQQKKILARLGISMASCPSDATHFVADKFTRTRNMLEIIALGKPVVTHLWLENCKEAGFYIDERKYILRDVKKEQELGFSLPDSLTQAGQRPLLGGYKVYVTPNVKPSQEVIISLVKALQGQQVVEPVWVSQSEDEKILDDLLILACEEDYANCIPFLQKGTTAYSSELLLNGIIIQKLEFERHKLFSNHVVRN